MKGAGWALVLAAALAVAAGLGAWLGRPPAAPAEPAAPVLPLPWPTPGSAPAAPPAPATAASPVPDRSPARPAPAPSGPRVGAEGYGPHIERALAGNDAAAAWEAVHWLRQCASNEGRRQSFETLRNQGVSPEMMTQMMVEADAEARRCQTVTAQHRALLAQLASRAMRAGVPEAAAAFAAATFPGDLTAAQRQQVADAMRRDALAGDDLSLVNAATANPAWGLSDAERLSFLMAYAELPGRPEARQVVQQMLEQRAVPLTAPVTPAQLAAAKVAAQQILARRAGRRP